MQLAKTLYMQYETNVQFGPTQCGSGGRIDACPHVGAILIDWGELVPQ